MQLALHQASSTAWLSRQFMRTPITLAPSLSGNVLCHPVPSLIQRSKQRCNWHSLRTRVVSNDNKSDPAKDNVVDSAASESIPTSVGDLPSTPLTSHELNVEEEVEEEDLFATKGLVKELTDSNQFGKRGEAWVFAQIVVLLLVAFPPVPLKGLAELLSILAMSAGVVFILYGLFSLGRNFFPLPVPRKKSTLVTTGMYGYVRHPLYAGLLLGSFGLALLTGSETRFAVAALLWWILDRKASLEETYLEQIHPQYKEYRGRVKKFIPFIY